MTRRTRAQRQAKAILDNPHLWRQSPHEQPEKQSESPDIAPESQGKTSMLGQVRVRNQSDTTADGV